MAIERRIQIPIPRLSWPGMMVPQLCKSEDPGELGGARVGGLESADGYVFAAPHAWCEWNDGLSGLPPHAHDGSPHTPRLFFLLEALSNPKCGQASQVAWPYKSPEVWPNIATTSLAAHHCR